MNTRLLAAALLLGSVQIASAQDFPVKSIRFILPYLAGGGTDLVARILAQKLTDAWGQKVIVENRTGAGGNIAMALATKARADGYTLLVSSTSLTINPFLYSDAGFDPIKDFSPITLATQQPYLIVVHPSVPARSVRDLIALVKGNPNKLNFGTSGPHARLAGELLKSMGGFDMTHVAYRGAGPALFDLIAGNLELTFTSPAVPLPFSQAGKLRILAVTSKTRLDIVPQIPTVAESGVVGYEVMGWFGVLAPAGTPKDIIDKLNAELVRILRLPELRERLSLQAIQPVGNSAAQFSSLIASETAKWSKLIKDIGLKAE